MIRGDDDQRALGHTAAQQGQLRVDAFEGADPFVAVPTVGVADLVRVADIQVGQAGRAGGIGRGEHTVARRHVRDVVGAAQRRLGQRRCGEFRQPRTGDAHATVPQQFEDGRLALQVARGDRLPELDHLGQLAGFGVALRVPGHAGQSGAGAGAERGHGRHRGAGCAGGDRPLVGRLVHQRPQVRGVAEPHRQIPIPQAIDQHHNRGFDLRQTQLPVRLVRVAVHRRRRRMPDRAGQRRQQTRQVQRSPTRGAVGVVPIPRDRHRSQQLLHLGHVHTHTVHSTTVGRKPKPAGFAVAVHWFGL